MQAIQGCYETGFCVDLETGFFTWGISGEMQCEFENSIGCLGAEA